ncbi:helix-turn-helix transcriptional regulator [Undibacterium sp.]|jgi:AraC-like DNA-binding protein|uniref:helix-turn-helix transcriptional regulator n=1 Tax=Undibacterium sp. TaxID=1914977 RepID=UPI002C2C2CB5|nr:AraC family transcriptional regulator ligand-binding domain-containing protein [Undibacterium sp.]HTD06477.1 AraC family transcriptional regulator ligand-binding domain-containing protein [Undibacterium sp.]
MPGIKTEPATDSPVLSVKDAIFPAHPFSGLFAIGMEQRWQLREMFPAFDLNDAGLPRSGRRISYLQARESLLQARHKGGADLGVLSGSRKTLHNLGAMGLGMLAQPTLGEAAKFGLHYQLVAGSMLQLELEIAQQHAVLVSHALFDDAEIQEFLDADHLATAVSAMRQLPCAAVQLTGVELRGNLNASRSVLEDFFGCKVRCGADASRLIFASPTLDTPLMAHYHSAQAVSQQACDRELAEMGVIGRQSLVRKLVSMQCEFHSVQDMAAALGISPRSLYRLLVREGTSYFHITESVRMERAKRLLLAGVTTEDAAERLGYSDARSFRRAFKRWTLLTPSDFRLMHANGLLQQ